LKTDRRIDSYIRESEAFARPILTHLRALVHAACPEVEETMKWGFPHFQYEGMLCSMASFKRHCSFGFWRAAQMKDAEALLGEGAQGAMGNFGKLSQMSDLPKDVTIKARIREAMRLNEKRSVTPVAPKAKAPAPKKPLRVPPDLKAGLAKRARAEKFFVALSPTQKREYIDWITEAKAPATRERRLATTLEWLAEGKNRNWKYEKRT